MVLRLKARESRSLPGLTSAQIHATYYDDKLARTNGAGWSSPVARQAHNLKVAGSNPAPATKILNQIRVLQIGFDFQASLK